MTSSSAPARRLEFRATGLQDLAQLRRFLDQACDNADAEARGDLKLAVEEVFANIFRHGYRRSWGPVDIHIDHCPGRYTVAIVDQAPVFDPASVAAPDFEAQAHGGGSPRLGLYLVRSVMDQFAWAPGDDCGNVYRLVRWVRAGLPDGARHPVPEQVHASRLAIR